MQVNSKIPVYILQIRNDVSVPANQISVRSLYRFNIVLKLLILTRFDVIIQAVAVIQFLCSELYNPFSQGRKYFRNKNKKLF